MEGLNVRTGTIRLSAYDFVVILYIFFIIFLDGTILFYGSALLLVAVGCIKILKKRKIHLNAFLTLMALFILFNAFTVLAGIVEFPEVSKNRIITTSLNYIVNICLFNYFLEKKNRNIAQIAFIYISFIFLLYIILQSGTSILSQRFGYHVPYLFSLRGTNGKAYNVNFICRVFYFGFCFCIHQSWIISKEILLSDTNQSSLLVRKRKHFILFSILFFFFSLLTGSRAGVIVDALFLFIAFIMRTNNATKKIKYIIGFMVVLITVYALIMYIPSLYSIVGHRFEILVKGFLSDNGYDSKTSVYYRNAMTDYGYEWFKQRPILGWGLDAYTKLSPYGTYSHNNFIEISLSSGIIGFLLYYGAMFVLLKDTLKRSKDKENIEAIIYFALLISILFMNVAHVDYLYRETLLFLYLVAAYTADWTKGTNYI